SDQPRHAKVSPTEGTPIPGFCACATSGHAAAVLPTNAIDSRRLMASPAEDHVGYQKNITFLARELRRSLHPNEPPPCPLWVRNGHAQGKHRCPLYPQKRTLIERVGMSALCQKQTHAPQHNERAKYKRALSRRALGTSVSVFV